MDCMYQSFISCIEGSNQCFVCPVVLGWPQGSTSRFWEHMPMNSALILWDHSTVTKIRRHTWRFPCDNGSWSGIIQYVLSSFWKSSSYLGTQTAFLWASVFVYLWQGQWELPAGDCSRPTLANVHFVKFYGTRWMRKRVLPIIKRVGRGRRVAMELTNGGVLIPWLFSTIATLTFLVLWKLSCQRDRLIKKKWLNMDTLQLIIKSSSIFCLLSKTCKY